MLKWHRVTCSCCKSMLVLLYKPMIHVGKVLKASECITKTEFLKCLFQKNITVSLNFISSILMTQLFDSDRTSNVISICKKQTPWNLLFWINLLGIVLFCLCHCWLHKSYLPTQNPLYPLQQLYPHTIYILKLFDSRTQCTLLHISLFCA